MRDAGLACGFDSRMLRDSYHSGGPPESRANRLSQRPASQNATPYLNGSLLEATNPILRSEHGNVKIRVVFDGHGHGNKMEIVWTVSFGGRQWESGIYYFGG